MSIAADNIIEFDAGPIWERRSQIPDGRYPVALKDWRTIRAFKRDTLQAAFVVVDGEHLGAVLMRFYVVTLTAKPQRRGHFKAARGSALVRDYAACFGLPRRLDRIPMTKFAETIVNATTRTVTTDSRQQDAPTCLHWSTVYTLDPA